MRTDGGCFAQTSIPVTIRNKASGLRSVAHQCATPADVGSWHVPGRRVPNRGNVVEDPLWDRIADGGNPGCQGQVDTLLGRSPALPRRSAVGQSSAFVGRQRIGRSAPLADLRSTSAGFCCRPAADLCTADTTSKYRITEPLALHPASGVWPTQHFPLLHWCIRL